MNVIRLSARQLRRVQAAAIVLIALLVYLPAIRAGFIWDDNRYVTENAFVQSDHGLPYIWISARTRDYYPVLYTSFWAEWRLWKGNPLGYHLDNVLLHALNAFLIWIILSRMRVPGAWLCGLLFAVHPLNVESVAWISQRKNTLAMFFFLLCFLTFPWRPHSRAFPRYCLALVLFILSLLTKPIVILFPLVILANRWQQWEPGERNTEPGIDNGSNRRRHGFVHAVGESVPFFAVAAIEGIMTVVFQQAHALKGVPVGAETLAGQVVTAARALWFYVGKALVPIRLSAVYPQSATDALSLPALIPLLAWGLLLFLLYRRRTTWGRPALFATAYFVLMLFPVLGFLDVGFMFYSMVADHWVYPALPALIAMVVGPLTSWFSRRSRAVRTGGIVLACAVVLLLSERSFSRCRLYRDMKTLATDTVRTNPRAWVAHVLLGNTAFSEGDLARSERHYQAALNENPGYWEALNGMGIVYASQGKLDKAIPLFAAVLEAKPEHTHARRNLDLAQRQKAARENTE